MSVIPVEFSAGSRVAVCKDKECDSLYDETVLVFGIKLDSSLKWIKLPKDLGGSKTTILELSKMKCPHCNVEHDSAKLTKKHNGNYLQVIECTTINQFIFFTIQNNQ